MDKILHYIASFVTGGQSDFIIPLSHQWHGVDVAPVLYAAAAFGTLAAITLFGLGCWRLVRRHPALSTFLGAALFATAAYAASTTLSNLSAGTAVSDTDLFYDVQTAGTGGVKITGLQLRTYIAAHVGTVTSVQCNGVTITASGTCGALTGDVTSSAGAAATTLKNTGPGATGPLGSTTTTPVVTIDAQGRVTGLTSATIALPTAANPTGTAGPTAVNGSATTFLRSDGAPAVQKGSNAQFGIVEGDTTTITCVVGVCSQVTATPSAANPSATAGPTAVNGSATTYMRSDGAPAVQKASNAQFGIMEGDGVTITCTAGVCTASTGGTGTVTSVGGGCGTSTGGSPITTTGNVIAAITRRANTTTSDTIVAADCGNVLSESNASPVADAIAQAGTTGFAAGAYFSVCNIGAGTATITPTTSTIGGASTLPIPGGSAAAPVCYAFQSDGTNYNIIDGPTVNATLLSSGVVAAARGGAGTISGALKGNGSGTVSQAACADLSNGTALCSTTPGTGVATAAANALSSAGGLTSTIASGTAVLGTSLIASGACATVVTVTATNVATTDVISFGFNSDPTAVTGYGASATGAVLTIYPYPTSGNANVKVCNSTASSITPSAMTLNWRATR